jgi:hypothetical protein
MNKGWPFQVRTFSFKRICIRLNIIYVCVQKKKSSLCKLKINYASGSESCVYSWYTGPHASKHFLVP